MKKHPPTSIDWSVISNIKKTLVIDVDSNDGIKFSPTSCLACKTGTTCLIDGLIVCQSCHTVADKFVDSSAEWRYYGADDSKGNDPSRCGLPCNDLLPNSSLGSLIGFGTKETYDTHIMRKYHMWNSMTYRERTLYNIFDQLNINAANNGITKSIIEEAKVLYKNVSDNHISRGSNRSGLIASSIYMACKNQNVPRSAKEIAKIFNIQTSTMTRGCKLYQDLMKINIETTTADHFINRFCSKLDITNEQREICRKKVKIADEYTIVSENTPPSIAVGIIFMCSEAYNWGICRKKMSDNCDISQVTISKCYKKLLMYKDILLSE